MRKRYIIAIVALSVLSAILVSAVAVLALSIARNNERSLLTSARHDEELAEYKRLEESLKSAAEEYRLEIDSNKTEIDSLNRQIGELKGEIEALSESSQNYDEYIQALRSKLDILSEKLAMKNKEYKDAEDRLSAWKSLLSVDVGAQTSLVNELMRVVASDAPMRVIDKKDGKDGETVEVYPKISFVYTDLVSGYSIRYKSDDIRYSASLIKLPYIYSIIREIDDFEHSKLYFDKDGKPLFTEDGDPLFSGEHPNLDEEGKLIYSEDEMKYDLSLEWTYDKETMFVEGSGKIRTLDDGTVLTYKELIEYTMLYSDNIAFDQLMKRFGYSSFYSLIYRLGIKGTSSGFMNLSASDCDKVLKEVYKYAGENEKSGKYLIELMNNSAYNALIGGSLWGIDVSHKYGWDSDAYHDMAIVWDEHPYSLVIMTDMDQGRSEDYGYIQRLSLMINKIHKGFYSYFDKLAVDPENEE